MTHDQILAIAKQSSLATDSPCLMPRDMDAIERFAELVAQHEREECAKVCEEWDTEITDMLAAAIRARKD